MSSQRQGLWYEVLDVVVNILVIVAIVVGIRTFLVSPFQVDGNSMLNTLEDKEYIVINKLAYFIGTPQRGDVVVLLPPGDHSKYFVKRIIGTPGDQVIIDGGNVFIRPAGQKKAEKLDEDAYLMESNRGHTFPKPNKNDDQNRVSYTVPAGRYFLLGDNRQNSTDSRSFVDQTGAPVPFVPQADIKGKVWFIVLPLSKIHALAPPAYAR